MRFFRYLLVQIAAYGLDMGGFLVAFKLLDGSPLLANVIGKVAAGIFAFLMHRSFTFKLSVEHYERHQATKYFLLLALNIPFSSAVFSITMLMVGPEVLAKFLADVICLTFTFWVSKRYIFTTRQPVFAVDRRPR